MITNVVFDIGNVLAGFEWEAFYRGFGHSEEILQKLAKATVKSPFWNEMDRGRLQTEEILDCFIQNDPSIEKEIREVFQNVKQMITRYDYAIPWIREVKEKGCRVYVISNFAEKPYQDCSEALDFLSETHGAVLSYQEQMIKPSPEIYRLLCSRYGLKPEECVFIDDMPVNVEAAIEQGMRGILFRSLEQAKKELNEMLSEKEAGI